MFTTSAKAKIRTSSGKQISGEQIMRRLLNLLGSVLFITQITYGSPHTELCPSSASTSEGTAWFYDPSQEFSYCIETHPNLRIETPNAQLVIEQVIAQWRNYMDERAVHHDLEPRLQISTNLKLKQSTPCAPDVNLVFLLGHPTNHPAVAAILGAQAPTAALSFAHRADMDVYAGTSRGFIWVAPAGSKNPLFNTPNWSTENTLHGVLLHEMGHVFGTGHIQGTIMDAENLDKDVFDASARDDAYGERARKRLRHIDQYRPLYDSDHYDFKVNGRLTPSEYTDTEVSVRAFKLFTDRSPRGRTRAALVRRQAQYYFYLIDEAGDHEFQVTLAERDSTLPIFVAERPAVFAVYRRRHDPGLVYARASSIALIQPGVIKTTSGEKLNVILNRGDGFRFAPWTMVYLKDNIMHPLFYANDAGY